MLGLTDIKEFLQSLGPLGAGGGIAFIILSVLITFRKNKFEEDEETANFRIRTVTDIQKMADIAIEDKLVAETRARRLMNALRIWCGFAHTQWLDRHTDRMLYTTHAIKLGFDPLILPDLKPLPPLIEENEKE